MADVIGAFIFEIYMFEINLLKRSEQEKNPEIHGKNVEVRIILIRHGEKNKINRKTGGLTETGRQQFRNFATENLGDPERNLIVYGGDLVRTIQSGLEATGVSTAKIKAYPEVMDELSLNIGSHDPKHKAKISPALMAKLSSMPMGENVKLYLGNKDKKPDQESISPREMAEGIVRIFLGYDEKIDRIKSETKNDILAVSSDYIIASFLQEVLGVDFDAENTLNFAEGLQFTIRTDEAGNHTYECKFRNKNYSLNKEQLLQWLQNGKN